MESNVQALQLVLLLFGSLFLIYKASAQKPQLSDKIYAVHLTATIEDPWHIYSQATPQGDPLPTAIVFKKNRLLVEDGKPKEVGMLLKKHEEVFDVDATYFNGQVDFVQTIEVKNKVRTNGSGSIEYRICINERCQPP